MEWRHRIKIKHLYTENEDLESIQNTMNAIADVLDESIAFRNFNAKEFRKIPEGDEVFGPVDYANKLLDRMYDFSDMNRIWIE